MKEIAEGSHKNPCFVDLAICRRNNKGYCEAKSEDECPVNNENSIFENEKLLKGERDD